MSKALVLKHHDKDDFEEYLERYLNDGYKMMNAGYTPAHRSEIRSGVPLSSYQRDFWWAILVKEDRPQRKDDKPLCD